MGAHKPNTKRLILVLALVLALGVTPAMAQALCPQGVWENRPGDQGAGIVDMDSAQDISGGSFVYVATDGGGVFWTNDRGNTWNAVGPCCSYTPCVEGKRIYSIVVAKDIMSATDWAVLIGTDDGVWRYDTASDSWMHVLMTTNPVTALAAPRDFSYEDWIGSGINQHVWAAERGVGIHRSIEAGDPGSWVETTQGDVAQQFLYVARMILAPDYMAGNPTFLFAGTRSVGGNSGRLLRFDAQGLGWEVFDPSLQSGVDLTALTTSSNPVFDGWLFLGTSSRSGPIFGSGQLIQSDSANSANIDFSQGCTYPDQRGIRSLSLSPFADPTSVGFPQIGIDRMLIGTDQGMDLTEDFSLAAGGPCSPVVTTLFQGRTANKVHYPAGYPGDPQEIVYSGTEGGFMVATLFDAGCAPKERSGGLRDFGITSLIASPNFFTDSTLYAGSETGGLLKSKDGGSTWQPFNAFYYYDPSWNWQLLGTPVVTDLGISNAYEDSLPAGPNKHLYMATRNNGVYRTQHGGWLSWENNGWGPDLNTPEARAGRVIEVSPNYVNGPLGSDATVVYGTAGAGVWRFDAQGELWCQGGNASSSSHSPCNTDCTFGSGICADLGSLIVNDLALSNTFFFDPAGSGLQDTNRTIYAATTLGLFKSIDYGENWQQIGDVPTANVLQVHVSPDYEADGHVYCVVENFGVFFSDDWGDTFVPANNGLPNPGQVNTMTISPDYPGDMIVLVGDRFGRFFFTTDEGQNWFQRASNGLPCNEGATELLTVDGVRTFAGFRTIPIQDSPDLADNFSTTFGYTNLPSDVAEVIATKNVDARTGEKALIASSPSWGLFSSFDGGQRWRPFGPGLEDTGYNAFYGAHGLNSTNQSSFGGEETIIAGTVNHGVINFPVSGYDFGSPSLYNMHTALTPSCDIFSDPFDFGTFTEITVFPDDNLGDPIFASSPLAGLFQSTDGGLCYDEILDPLAASSTNLDFGDGGAALKKSLADDGGKGLPTPLGKLSNVIWSTSLSGGISYSDNSGVSFSSANGTGNTQLPNTATNTVIQHSSTVVVVGTDETSGTNIGGVYWSPDEGVTTWVESQTLDSTYNVVEMIEVTSNGDILAAEDDSVWLSGDRGNHWIDIGATLDPGASLADIVSDSGTPPEYYVGSTVEGSYAATITAGTYPTVTSLDVTSGPGDGGTSVTITGTGFESGAVCTFGGVDSDTVTVNNTTSITCETPPHFSGLVDVGVRNTDTREGLLADAYTYTSDSDITTVTVTKDGSNAVVAWTVSGATGIYKVTRSDMADFTDLGATIDTYDVYYGLSYEDPDSGSVYFYQVD